MHLTKDDEKMLSGGYGEGYRKAMEIMVKLGDYYDAKRLVPLDMAFCVLGMDAPNRNLYKWLKEFADMGTTFKCPLTIATYHPGDNLDQKMGAVLSEGGGGSPRGLSTLPLFGQVIAGAGTNVTAYCNSIIGAKSNSEGPVGQYASAIVGKTPEYGAILPENRLGKILYTVKAKLKNYTDWNALGFYITKTTGAHWWDIPVVSGIKPSMVTTDDIYNICSTIASWGSANHWLMEGISPEARTLDEAFGGEKPKEKIIIGDEEIKSIYDRFPPIGKKPDVVELSGTPGMSISNIVQIAEMVKGKKINKDVTFMVPLTPAVKYVADNLGLTKILVDAGVELGGKYKGKPINIWTEGKKRGIKVVVCDSAKHCHYEAQQEIETVLMPLEKCVKTALTGSMEV